ncbi:MAG: TrkA family potassium uptake protein [Clostridia bacterium]|nr:TrkA family potassium uptake protein [Clostridia bacterium]
MKSILIIGMGRTGRYLADDFQRLGCDVLVMDKSRDNIEMLGNRFTDARIADGTNENVIKALGVSNFDYCFVCIGEDFQSSLIITSLLKKNGASHIISKANHDIQQELLRTIGADEIFFPEKDVAHNLAIRYSASNIFDYVELTQDYSIYEIPILPDWVGKTIIELDIRRRYGINIVAIKNGTLLNPSPAADYTFAHNDHIMVISKSKDVFKLTSKIK